MEMRVESNRPIPAGGAPPIRLRLLGPLAILRDGTEVPLPASRKVRALFVYLALAPRAVTRTHLCELLWDAPSDPRGELRWCLSKIRGLIDGVDRRRVETRGDTVRFDLSDCLVDAVDVAKAVQDGIDTITPDRMRALEAMMSGDFAEGLEIDRSPAFMGWVTAQRRRFRGCRAALLERLASTVADEEKLAYLEKWLALVPFDRKAHEVVLTTLAHGGRIREGEEHLAAATRMFDAEGLDCAALRHAWRSARAQQDEQRIVLASPSGSPAGSAGEDDNVVRAARRASIAVMPFVDRAEGADANTLTGRALAHDVISRLAKLRSLFVIAQGTVIALHERRIGSDVAGRMLDIDYVVSGWVRRDGARISVAVELAEARTARIVWAEIFNQKMDDALVVLEDIGNRIVASIASEIEAVERNRAILKPPNSLDAWEAYHRGLWHMYRFNRPDNDRARQFFDAAIRLDPTFARAYAGLSFTHFQNAFQGWGKREPETERAYEAAGQGLVVDERDPAAHWAMGRALWLRREHDQAVVELGQAIDLSPNFALAHYTLAFVHSQAGDPTAAIRFSDHSRHLSPFDPLLFGMLGARAMALTRLGRFDEAAEWAVKAAARPNAHAHIRAIAAFALALAGQMEPARAYVASIRKMTPGYRVHDFLAAMQFGPEGEALFRQAAEPLGIS